MKVSPIFIKFFYHGSRHFLKYWIFTF
uniref:Uncharacterized protein n=1 Tax=Arundo donax TaxID=35708 RepID=A0A0A9AZR8_ARUDO